MFCFSGIREIFCWIIEDGVDFGDDDGDSVWDCFDGGLATYDEISEQQADVQSQLISDVCFLVVFLPHFSYNRCRDLSVDFNFPVLSNLDIISVLKLTTSVRISSCVEFLILTRGIRVKC